MCHKTKCGKCGKWSWWGCGYHIDGALAGVPMEERCEHKPRSMAEKKEWASRPKPEGESKSLWERLFG